MPAARIVVNPANLERLLMTGEGAPVHRAVARATELVLQEAKRLCPTSPYGSDWPDKSYHGPGTLRSSLKGSVTGNGANIEGRVYTEMYYAPFVEYGTKPHVITSHGNYPLRNRFTGQVFGKTVHHPGTVAQPFLRPALDVLHGRRFT